MPKKLSARDSSGVELDANFALDVTANGFDIVIESRSGFNRAKGTPARNPDYETLFELVLHRAAGVDATLAGAWVESGETDRLGLDPDERLLRASDYPYPVRLAEVRDINAMRTTVCGKQGAIGRRTGAKGPGNRNKRVRLSFYLPESLDLTWCLAAIIDGDSPLTQAQLATLLPECDAAGLSRADLARLDRLLARYARATPLVRQRVVRAIERGPVGNLLKGACGYTCQICRALALPQMTFRKSGGTPYVEAHHVVPVADGVHGSLHPANVIIVCAMHHRELHHGAAAWIDDQGSSFKVTVELGTVTLPKPDLIRLLEEPPGTGAGLNPDT